MPAALAWPVAVFDFVEAPQKAVHAEMKLDGQLIMLGQGSGGVALCPRCRHQYAGHLCRIADAVAHFARAEAAGSQIVHPPADLPYGGVYQARDLDLHAWFFTTPTFVVDQAA